MSLRTKVAATAFIAASLVFTGVAGAEQKPGTWKPAPDYDGLSPGSFKTQCESSGGEASFEGGDTPMWSCAKEGSGGIYCDQGSDVTSTNCRRHTPAKFSRPGAGNTYPSDGGVFIEGGGESPGTRIPPSGNVAGGAALNTR